MHPELLSLSLFMLGTSCSPGPNNIVASYSGFNFGVVKTFPHMLGVIFGFTAMVSVLNFGLINVFKIYPLLQEILKVSGSLFLVYLAYKIAFSKNQTENKKENPVKFFDTFFFQFLNPKGVIVGIIIVSTYVESGNNFINYSFDNDPFSKNINSSVNSDNYTVNKKVFADEIKMMYEFIEFKYFKKVMKQNKNIFNS